MKETTNLKLHLITESASDKSMLFSEWRKLIAGDVADSNMNVIDLALGECLNQVANLVTEDTDGLILTMTNEITAAGMDLSQAVADLQVSTSTATLPEIWSYLGIDDPDAGHVVTEYQIAGAIATTAETLTFLGIP